MNGSETDSGSLLNGLQGETSKHTEESVIILKSPLTRRNFIKLGFAFFASAVPALLVKTAADYLGSLRAGEGRVNLPKSNIADVSSPEGPELVPLMPVPVIQTGAATPNYPPGFNAHTDAEVNRPLRPKDPPGLRINPVDGKEFVDR